MFTGIIEGCGKVRFLRDGAGGRRLGVELDSRLTARVKLGDSVCVSGTCLTVCAIGGSTLEFDVIPETLHRTNLGAARSGDRVNIERSLPVDGRLDGHFVQGHVDGRGRVARIDKPGKEWVVVIRPDSELLPYIVPKGSVAVDGVSLTIARVEADEFAVALIPTTLELTTLGDLAPGSVVNIETDIIARTVVYHLSRRGMGSDFTPAFLQEHGFA